MKPTQKEGTMIRFCTMYPLCALLLVVSAPSALAVHYEGRSFTAELPEGWEISEHGRQTSANSPVKVSDTIQWWTEDLEEPDLTLYLKILIKDGKLRKISEVSYIFVSEWDEGRYWVGINPEGDLLGILISRPVSAVPSFLKSLQPKEKSWSSLLQAAKTQEVVDWLSFASEDLPASQVTPPFAENFYDGSPTEPFSGYGFRAAVPKGWIIEHPDGNTVVFTSPKGVASGYVKGATIALPEGSGFEEECRAHARKLGGKNIRLTEDSIKFDIPDDRKGECASRGRAVLLKVYLDDWGYSQELMGSLSFDEQQP